MTETPPNRRETPLIGACRARHCARATFGQRGAIHTMALPGNPRGRAFRCDCAGSEAGSRRAIGVVAVLQSSLSRPRRWCDAGSPQADQKARAPGSQDSATDPPPTGTSHCLVAGIASPRSLTSFKKPSAHFHLRWLRVLRAFAVHTRDAPRDQNPDPGSLRNSTSSGVDSRPRMALRCGKRPKRSMIL